MRIHIFFDRDDDDYDDDYDEDEYEARRTRRDIGHDPAMRMLLLVGRSPLAIVAGYLGLMSIIPIFAPLALLFGILAVMDIKNHPKKHGMGRAIFGLAMGAIFTLLLIVFLLAAMAFA